MTELRRPEVAQGAFDQYTEFAELLEALDDRAWHAPTRCEGFEVHDVAGHVVGLAEDVVRGVPGSRTAVEEAAALRDFSSAEVAKHLRTALEPIGALVNALDDDAWNGPSPVEGLSLGRGVLTLWYDTYVHTDDIRAALDLPPLRGPGLRAAVEYLAGELESRGWGPAEIALDGLPPYAVGAGGPKITGDPLTFTMIATGRLDPEVLGLDATVNIYAA